MKPNNDKKAVGDHGEKLACKHLVLKGYQIIKQNLRIGRAEIDIVAQIKQTVVFVEVKTRTTKYYGFPEEFVTPKKEELFFNAEEIYCIKNEIDNGIRFDIISIILSKNKTEITHFEDAFWPMA